MLVDMIMNKGMETCQLFLDLLQTDEAIQKTYPELKYILESTPQTYRIHPDTPNIPLHSDTPTYLSYPNTPTYLYTPTPQHTSTLLHPQHTSTTPTPQHTSTLLHPNIPLHSYTPTYLYTLHPNIPLHPYTPTYLYSPTPQHTSTPLHPNIPLHSYTPTYLYSPTPNIPLHSYTPTYLYSPTPQHTYTPTPQHTSTDGQYELKSQPTGLCLIINNKDFGGGIVRIGTDKDAGRLGKVFSWLGFRVLMCTDQTKNQMERALECFASQCDLSQLQEFKVQEWTGSGFTDLREAPRHGDAFICCLLSHGDKGVVSGVDRKPLPIKDITRTFMATPQSPLTGKPKVFLIQACQGHQIHPVISGGLQADSSPSTLQAVDSPSTFIPQEADFLVHCSTVQDYYSMRDTTKGSWFIQSVCNQLEEGCKRNDEIEVILRRVNKEVAGIEYVLKCDPSCDPSYGQSGCPKCGRTTQMPAIRHTLTKRLVLTSQLKPHRQK
ncbi:hypothetical protein KUCAC02_031424 [Chaenocephalus aceratus]|nr:hypothetical protein KUCAC02_031424 [Chaenocephalus aceratus]